MVTDLYTLRDMLDLII